MKEKNNTKLMLFASICFYVSALLAFISKNHTMGITYLMLGSVLSCMYATGLNQTDSEEDKQEEEINQAEEVAQMNE